MYDFEMYDYLPDKYGVRTSNYYKIKQVNGKAVLEEDNRLAKEDTGLTPQNVICREDDVKLLQRQNKEFREEINRLRDKYEI